MLFNCPTGAKITFLAVVGIAAVPRSTAGLADGNGPLATGAVGLVAGAEVTGAPGWYGGAAAVRRGVTLGEDRILRAGSDLQGGTDDPSTPQLLWETETSQCQDKGNLINVTRS